MNERLIPVTDVTYVYFRWTGPLSLYGHVCHWHQISLCACAHSVSATTTTTTTITKTEEKLSTNHIYMCALFPNKIY